METYTQLKQLLEGLEPDMEKFYDKGNKAAGTRVRKGLQEVKKLSQTLRVEIQERKNAE